MAERDQAQEKNQEPTQRRLDKAKEDGDILTSKEMFVFATGAAGLLVIVALGLFSGRMLEIWGSLFVIGHPEELGPAKLSKSLDGLYLIFLATAVFGIPTVIGALFIQIFVGGSINFSSKSVSFKFEKLDPIKGLGRIFSVKGLVELLKSLAKVILLLGAVVSFLWGSLPNLIYLSEISLDQSLEFLYNTLISFIFVILFVLFVIGIGDYIWSRHTWLQKLRMSHQDLKEEAKENEGSPEVKARIRKLQIEASRRAAQRNEALENVKDATVVITNPTHFAVAIRYEPSENDAPKIIAMGEDILAKRLIDKANENSVMVVRSPILARALYFTSDIGLSISERLYSAVASILAYVYQIEQGIDVTFQDPDVPSDLIFDEFGKVKGA